MKRVSVTTTIALSLFSSALIFMGTGQRQAKAATANATSDSTLVQPAKTAESTDPIVQAATTPAKAAEVTPTTASTSAATTAVTADDNQAATTTAATTATTGATATTATPDSTSQSATTTPATTTSTTTSTTPAATATTDAAKLPTTATTSAGESVSVPTTHVDDHAGVDATVDQTIDLGISNLGDNAKDYDSEAATNKTLQLAEAGSEQVVKTSQGNVTAYYNTKSGEMVLVANNKVLTVPKFGSVDVTDDSGHTWNIYNLATGKMGVQDAVDSNVQRTATASVGQSAANIANGTALGAANAVNLAADLGESVIAEPINVLKYGAMIGLGVLSAIPIIGIIPLIADGILILGDSAWHGIQYGWSTARRAAVLAPALAGAVAGPVLNGANAAMRANNAKITGFATDQSLSAEANRQLAGSVASSVSTAGAIGADALLQAGTFVAHTITEAAFVGTEVVLGVLSAVPLLGIIPLAIDGVVITAHSLVNLGQRVADEGRRAVILGAGGLASKVGPAINTAHSVQLKQQAQKHNNDTYTWNLK